MNDKTSGTVTRIAFVSILLLCVWAVAFCSSCAQVNYARQDISPGGEISGRAEFTYLRVWPFTAQIEELDVKKDPDGTLGVHLGGLTTGEKLADAILKLSEKVP